MPVRFAEYRNRDAIALAELVRAGDTSASELLELAIARAEAVNPRLNAIVLEHFDLARKAAAAKLRIFGPPLCSNIRLAVIAVIPVIAVAEFCAARGAANRGGTRASLFWPPWGSPERLFGTSGHQTGSKETSGCLRDRFWDPCCIIFFIVG